MNILLCPLSQAGYLYPALAVGQNLRRRGHHVTTLGRRTAEPLATEAGLDFVTAAGTGSATGFSVARWFTDASVQYHAVLNEARNERTDVIVTSVLAHGALLAAEVLQLPVVVIGLAAHLWNYHAGADGEPEERTLRGWRSAETARHYQRAREQVGLRPRRDRTPERPLYGDGLLLRGDPVLEYPGAELPAEVHYVGPCRWEPAMSLPESMELTESAELAELGRQAGRRVGNPATYRDAYVHLGRSFGGESRWPQLNRLFRDGRWRAVVEQGRSGPAAPDPGTQISVVAKPWLRPYIDAADLVLTSGTSSATLAALEAGRPLVMAPAGSEQPLLTEACERAGLAVRLPAAADPACLDAALDDPDARARRAEVSRRMRAADGAVAATRYVETFSSAGTGVQAG